MKEIRIISTEKVTKEGKKFLVHKAQKKDNTWCSLKFTRDCEGCPKNPGQYFLNVEEENCSFAASDFGDVLWVHGNVTVTPYKRPVDERFMNEF